MAKLDIDGTTERWKDRSVSIYIDQDVTGDILRHPDTDCCFVIVAIGNTHYKFHVSSKKLVANMLTFLGEVFNESEAKYRNAYFVSTNAKNEHDEEICKLREQLPQGDS